MTSDFRGGALGLLYSILSVCMVLRCSQKFVTITVLVLSSLHTWQLGTTNIPKTHWGSSPSVKQVAVHHTRLYKIFLLSWFFVSIWPPTSNQKLWVTFRCMQFRNFQAVRELEIENCKNPLFWKSKKISVTLQRCWQKSAYWQKIFFDYSNREHIWAERWRQFWCYWRSETKLLEVRLHHYQVK